VPTPRVRWSLASPAAAGAIALVELEADTPTDLDDAFARLQIRPVPVGALALRTIPDLDTPLIARFSTTRAQIMPHGGPAVVRTLLDRFASLSIAHADAPLRRPEASSLLESRMLDALSVAPSPRAIDLLFAQPALWQHADPNSLNPDILPPGTPSARDRRLARLLHPPLVVAWGPANIGKSTLCNAFAGRDAALVADQPGTTRDHVGVTLDLDGVTVRYADTPGVRDTTDPLERAAQTAAADLARRADLLLLCGDPATPPLPSPSPAVPSLRLCLRADLGTPTWPFDLTLSAPTGTGIPDLAIAVRRALIPDADLAPARPWRFWDADESPSDPT
jgi:hypothetical protein